MVLVTFIARVILDPIFNKFEPLQKGKPVLVQAIQGVTKGGAVDIPPERMYELQASRRGDRLQRICLLGWEQPSVPKFGTRLQTT